MYDESECDCIVCITGKCVCMMRVNVCSVSMLSCESTGALSSTLNQLTVTQSILNSPTEFRTLVALTSLLVAFTSPSSVKNLSSDHISQR